MKMMTIGRITGMLPSGVITGVRVLGTGLVPDSYEFGMRQWPTIEASPVTGKIITVYHPEMHAEGADPDIFYPGTEDHAQAGRFQFPGSENDPALD